jgi:hypothetical protein
MPNPSPVLRGEKPMPNPSPVLIADKCTLTFSAEAGGKIRVTYQSWEDAKAVLPGQHIEIRRGPQGVELASWPTRSTTSCRTTVPTEPKLLIPAHTGFTKEAVRIMSVAETLRSIAAGRRIKHDDMMRWCRVTAEYLEDTVREMPPGRQACRTPSTSVTLTAPPNSSRVTITTGIGIGLPAA